MLTACATGSTSTTWMALGLTWHPSSHAHTAHGTQPRESRPVQHTYARTHTHRLAGGRGGSEAAANARASIALWPQPGWMDRANAARFSCWRLQSCLLLLLLLVVLRPHTVPPVVAACRPSLTPGAAPTALHSGGAVVDETGIMTDGAGVPTGTPLSDPPLVAAISEDPLLRNVKLIAEAWDCDGLYQVCAGPPTAARPAAGAPGVLLWAQDGADAVGWNPALVSLTTRVWVCLQRQCCQAPMY